MSSVSIAGLSKIHGNGGEAVVALDDLDLEVRQGEFLCILGASGCGKSTLLHLLAGLDGPTEGTIESEGRSALLFQEAALFPWQTATANVELALKLRGLPKSERPSKAAELLQMVQLSGAGHLRPHQLSGGMRQRVALARALAQDADLLLMDEPFGALDAMTRDLLHHELEQLWLESGFTVIFVTHNVREAVRLGDRVVLLTSRPGRVAETFEVPLGRPRSISTPEVNGYVNEITDRLLEEVRRHVK